eukprot:TRINITY_DN18852_c0_g1_i1.p1 TRINITY_DN18852_c0_g1~~TRINITY_DN18852_c0_g1_i1.p1  ORF type:complete len:459 (+),score=168.34 TRINITY_DN18852_c0_g1_i1:73-1449(+)
MDSEKPICVMGAGLVGSLMACYLARRGSRVAVYERRSDMRKGQAEAGRSINLALSERGMTALREIGLADEVLKICIPMRGRMLHAVDGTLTFQPYSKDGKSAILSVSRGDLNIKLMDYAETLPGVEFVFDARCTGVDLRTAEVSLVSETTKEAWSVAASTVLGCDGAFSAVRGSLLRTPRVDYSISHLTHGYKELTIPPGPNGEHRLDKNCLHIWPRGSYMMIALPNLDGSFTVTCFWPFEGENGFDRLDQADWPTVKAFFEAQFADSLSLMPSLEHDFYANKTSALFTVRCWPWSRDGAACLFGDAAHAVVPFFGQGMNAGFEDCTVFNAVLDRQAAASPGSSPDWAAVFAEFQKLRKSNADAIADMALENHIEMRDKVADKLFQLRKKVEALLGTTFPGRFNSRYEMVSFSTIPYRETQRLGLINDEICEELMKGIDDVKDVDLEKAKALIGKYFP